MTPTIKIHKKSLSDPPIQGASEKLSDLEEGLPNVEPLSPYDEQQDTPPVLKHKTKSLSYLNCESVRLLDTVYECPDDSFSSIGGLRNSFIGSH